MCSSPFSSAAERRQPVVMWNTTQQRALAIIPKCAAFLSLMGSSWVIVEITTTKTKIRSVYHRLLLSMAIYDVFENFWNFASTWPIPRGTQGVWGAVGTTQTCVAQGFFLQLGLAVPLYNASLAIYYMLVIKYSMSEDKLRKRVEPVMHAAAFLFASGTAFASVGLDLFNNANLWCWIAEYPLGCKESYQYGDEGSCERGNNAFIYRWAFYFAPLWFCIISSTVAMLAIYMRVEQRESRTSIYRNPELNSRQRCSSQESQSSFQGAHFFRKAGSPALPNETEDSSTSQSTKPVARIRTAYRDWQGRNAQNRAANPRTYEVLHQALFYVAAFYMTHLFSTVNRLLQQTRSHMFYPLIVLQAFFDPLQGFLTFLVYRRSRYLRYRKKHVSRVESLKKSLRWTWLGPEQEAPQSGLQSVLPNLDEENNDNTVSQSEVNDVGDTKRNRFLLLIHKSLARMHSAHRNTQEDVSHTNVPSTQ